MCLHASSVVKLVVVVAVKTITAALKDTSIPRYNSIYARVEYLLSYFINKSLLNRSSLSNNGFYSYSSLIPDCRRISSESTFIFSFFSYSFVS
jgi:hypothetical protein